MKRLRTKRRFYFERLELRRLLAADFRFLHNAIDPEDVNGDAIVAPDDALMIINELNGLPPDSGSRFVDVDADGLLAPGDALMVINRLHRPHGHGHHGQFGRGEREIAPIDGIGNNLDQPQLGSTGAQLLRLTSVEYGDGISSPAGDDRPSAREVSNAVAAQTESVENGRLLTDLSWLWGQFIDHDIDLTGGADPAEPFAIEVPHGDAWFDPFGTGTAAIDLSRSTFDPATGDADDNPRQQVNEITAFLDGSVVYGSDQERADALRSFAGGRLNTSDGDLLPFNTAGLPNAGGPSDTLFLAGDVRANENAALTAMHTLWVREHNRIADEIADRYPQLNDEQIYQHARATVTAEIQAITYNEFLPALLGRDAVADYQGYDASVDPGIANVFSTAAYRFGHSMLSPELLRLDNDGTTSAAGNLALRDAFFAPGEVIDNGIDSLLLGAAVQTAQEIDTLVIDDVRNFLFGPPGAGGFDLASLNIQRGRDHGLPDYNQARIDMGLAPATNFADITSNVELQETLEQLYGDVDNVDVWVGGLAEDHVPGASVGELVYTVLVDQFQRIRDGDRFWYQNTFTGGKLAKLESTTLADVIRRNTDVTDLQENVFYDPSMMYVERSAGDPPMNLLLTAGDDGAIEVVDQHRRQTVDSRAADELTQVVLIGARGADRFTIDATGAILSLPGSVIVDGADGRRDTLVVRGAADTGSILVENGHVTVGATTIAYRGIENIIVAARGHDIDVQLADGVEAHVVVADGSGSHHDRPPHHRESPHHLKDESERNRDDRTENGRQPFDRLPPLDGLPANGSNEQRTAHDLLFTEIGSVDFGA